jgi:hypothetical protein
MKVKIYESEEWRVKKSEGKVEGKGKGKGKGEE